MSDVKVEKVVLQFGGKQYEVKSTLWEGQQIAASIVGDARVIVRRGAVVANIPSDVPFGTFCVCVNLASINNDVPTDAAAATKPATTTRTAAKREEV